MRFVGIDPSSKTGFVVLDKHGNAIRAKELTGVGSEDPKRMVTLIDDIMDHIQQNDIVCIEGFAFGAKGRGISFQFGLGHGIRNALFRRNINFTIVTPAQLKKFATGKGNAKKENMILPIFRHWNFEHSSDNVRDAYVLAQIARALTINDSDLPLSRYHSYQLEVISAIEGSAS